VVQCEGRSWIARLDCSVSAGGGVVDQFEIRAPDGWNGPYQVSRRANFRSASRPAKGGG